MKYSAISAPQAMAAVSNLGRRSRETTDSKDKLGLLIFVFYFTSKNLLYYQHLLVNMEQHSKKDLVCEQVEMI